MASVAVSTQTLPVPAPSNSSAMISDKTQLVIYIPQFKTSNKEMELLKIIFYALIVLSTISFFYEIK
jgi:hypothetical protein